MSDLSTAVTAYQGQDTLDLLDHIAWTDVLRPKLEQHRKYLTDKLVSATLSAPQPNSESKEQIAGKLYGIQFMINTIEKVLRAGANAKAALAEENLFLQ